MGERSHVGLRAERADVALVLIDTSEGLVDHDLAIADIARKAQDSTMVVLSKWDLTTVGIEDVRPELERRLQEAALRRSR